MTDEPQRGPASRVPGRPCSIAAALLVVGEKWALPAIREINLGNHRFEQIAANTGAPRDILTTRLRGLEQSGVVYRRRYLDRPPRYEYHLTEAGKGLRPVLHALLAWGDRWLVDAPPTIVEHSCGHELTLVSRCAHCGELVDLADDGTTARFRSPGWDRQGRVQ